MRYPGNHDDPFPSQELMQNTKHKSDRCKTRELQQESVSVCGIAGTYRDGLSSSSTALIRLHYGHSTSELQQPSQDSVYQSVTELVPPLHPCPVSCIDPDIIQGYFGQRGLKGKCSSKTATGKAETRWQSFNYHFVFVLMFQEWKEVTF